MRLLLHMLAAHASNAPALADADPDPSGRDAAGIPLARDIHIVPAGNHGLVLGENMGDFTDAPYTVGEETIDTAPRGRINRNGHGYTITVNFKELCAKQDRLGSCAAGDTFEIQSYGGHYRIKKAGKCLSFADVTLGRDGTLGRDRAFTRDGGFSKDTKLANEGAVVKDDKLHPEDGQLRFGVCYGSENELFDFVDETGRYCAEDYADPQTEAERRIHESALRRAGPDAPSKEDAALEELIAKQKPSPAMQKLIGQLKKNRKMRWPRMSFC